MIQSSLAQSMPDPSLSSSNRLLLIDGYGFVFRAYHSMPPLTNPEGTPVGAVFGFTNMLMKVLMDHTADHLAVVLDAGQKTFRNEIYSEYKANRPPAPEDLIPQFPLVREAVHALNVPAVDLVGVEADDIIATYAKQAERLGWDVTIISSDKDLMQLVTERVTMYDAMKSRTIGIEQVQEKFGVPPEKVLDVLSMMGDSADNIPGIPGIGPKTATELVNQFGSLEAVLDGAASIKQNKRRENILANKDMALLSRDLIRLKEDVELPVAIDELAVRDVDPAIINAFLHEHGFKSLYNKVVQLAGDPRPVPPMSSEPAHRHDSTSESRFHLVESPEQLTPLLNQAATHRQLVIALPIPGEQHPTGIAFAAYGDEAFYVPFKHGEAKGQASFDLGDIPEAETTSLSLEKVITIIQPLLDNPSILKIGYDIKRLMHLCQHNIAPNDDIMLMSYVFSAGKHSQECKSVIQQYLDKEFPILDIKQFSSLAAEDASHQAGQLALDILFAHRHLKHSLFSEHMLTVYERCERPLSYILYHMEQEGIFVDKPRLSELSHTFHTQILSLEKEIYALANEEFNIGSPKQLGQVLFENLGLKAGKKSSKTGAYSTGADILEELAAEGHIIAEKVLEWRHFSKLRSTYTEALQTQISPVTGRVHTHFSMATTTTGRLSSNDPNLQNIPIRSEEGQLIRTAFIAKPGYKLISADYSQIELRLLAHLANIDSLKQAFKEGKDIHAITASEIFNVPLDEMDPLTRRKAKAINFGIIYGISGFGLANQINVSRKEAQEIIEAYYARYPGIRDYMEQTKAFAHKHGYVTTMFGRRCYVPAIREKNPSRRHFAERAAINAPLQGTAADIIKKAMIHLPPALAKAKLDATILLQVHDELIFEVNENQTEETAALVRQTMEQAGNSHIQLVVDLGIGNNWAEIH